MHLTNEVNQPLDEMIYWRAKRDEHYGADGPFTALQAMHSTVLEVLASASMEGTRQIVTAYLKTPVLPWRFSRA